MIMALDTYKKKGLATALLVVVLLVIDQVIKVEVKTGMCLHESIRVTDWFYINFIENNGMAYGMTIGNKLILSLFRVAAISVLGWYLCRQVRCNARIMWFASPLSSPEQWATLSTACSTGLSSMPRRLIMCHISCRSATVTLLSLWARSLICSTFR